MSINTAQTKIEISEQTAKEIENTIEDSREEKGGVEVQNKLEENRQEEDMSDYDRDQYDHFNYDYEKYIHTGHSGKNRSKYEAVTRTNHFDPCGHSRKILTKLMNTEHKKRHIPKTKA